jgi:CRP-like cAMP-binding protein
MKPARSGVETLRRAPPFRSLSDRDCEALVLCSRPREYRRGEVVFGEGEPGSFLVVVTEGTLVATTREPGGVIRELGRVGPGELAGEMAFLDPAPRSATVTAAGPAAGYAIDHDAMDVLRHNAPDVARALTSAALLGVTGRLRRLEERTREALRR